MKGYYPSGEPIEPWEEVRARIENEARAKRDRPTKESKLLDRNQDKPTQEQEDSEKLAEVEGELPPLVSESARIMVCVGYKVLQTHFGPKDNLYWV